jgi:hypothetical protein
MYIAFQRQQVKEKELQGSPNIAFWHRAEWSACPDAASNNQDIRFDDGLGFPDGGV